MIKNRGIILPAIVFLVSACAHYTLVEPAKRDMGGGYSVEPQIVWNRSAQGKIEIWTIDGPALAAVHFFNGIGDGQNLFPFYGKSTRKAKLPKFNKNMTASEVQEFIVDSMLAPYRRSLVGPNMIGTGVQTFHLRPYKFGSHPGFRFELSFLSEEGLEYEGFVVGAIKADKLYLICYSGTREYYYPKYKETAEQIIASIHMP
ncbi:MAG: hypothetical protein KAI93_15535 [Desulfobacterales bacterium]|nr:hypothetical protein [Desulfobacterales bacterium]